MNELKRITWQALSGFVIATLLLVWLAAPVAQAVNSGFRNATANITGGPGYGNGFEITPTNAYADGSGVAQNIDGAGNRHEYYNFGFNTVIPADAVITGIEIRLDGAVDQAANNARYEVDLTWNVAASFTAAQSTPNLTATEATYLLGGPDFLWGRTWTASELADEIFAVRITSIATGLNSNQRDFFLDYITVRVYYATARITGLVWSDDDSSGTRNGAEAGLNTVPLTFFRDDGDGIFEGGAGDAQVGAATTNASGVYTSTPFLDGFNYWVDVTAPLNRTLTNPPEPRLVNIPTGANAPNINFGYAPTGTANPAVDIAKTPDLQTVVSGSTVTFTVALTNTGNTVLANVVVTDTLAPTCSRALGLLSSGQSQSYTCSLSNVAADFVNVVQIGGVYTPTNTTVTDSDSAAVDVINPALVIAKTPDSQAITSGGSANFTIAVTNTGDVPLTGVTISDLLAPDCNRNLGTLNVAQGQTFSCALTNVTADFVNTALAFGTTPINTTVSGTDTAAVDVVGPAISIEKSPDLQSIALGRPVTFTISVTNTGDVPLNNVTVSDPLAPDCDRSLGTLLAGAGQTYACALPNLTAAFTNTAAVTCSGPTGPLSDSDTAAVRVNPFPDCPTGLAALYSLNEATGGPYTDQYGGPNAVCAGNCPIARAGRVGGAQEFDGLQTGLSTLAGSGPAAFDWGAGSSFAIEVWMRANPANSCARDSAEVIVGRGNLAGLQWWLGLACFSPTVSKRAAFFLRDQAGVSNIVIGTRVIADGTWHHLVAVREAATNEMRLYVDGALEGTTSQAFSAGFTSATAPLRVGWLPLDVNYRYDGLVDELAVHNQLLTPNEIQRHYNLGLLSLGYCQADLKRVYLPLIARNP